MARKRQQRPRGASRRRPSKLPRPESSAARVRRMAEGPLVAEVPSAIKVALSTGNRGRSGEGRPGNSADPDEGRNAAGRTVALVDA